jgi:hypothetical protein
MPTKSYNLCSQSSTSYSGLPLLLSCECANVLMCRYLVPVGMTKLLCTAEGKRNGPRRTPLPKAPQQCTSLFPFVELAGRLAVFLKTAHLTVLHVVRSSDPDFVPSKPKFQGSVLWRDHSSAFGRILAFALDLTARGRPSAPFEGLKLPATPSAVQCLLEVLSASLLLSRLCSIWSRCEGARRPTWNRRGAA